MQEASCYADSTLRLRVPCAHRMERSDLLCRMASHPILNTAYATMRMHRVCSAYVEHMHAPMIGYATYLHVEDVSTHTLCLHIPYAQHSVRVPQIAAYL